jgi:L-alanine-DL-glutamate epimerase-like enolase superfamily enzyme
VLRDPFRTADVLAAVDATAPGNTAAKAAFDIALHDWLGKALGQPVHRLLGLSPAAAPPTSFTIGIDAPDVVRQRLLAAAEHASYKVKLGGADDRGMIAAMREVTDKPIRVDVNQGWVDRERALDTIGWLAEHGVELVEQPMPRERVADLAWLRERSSLPIVADEGVQRLSDVAAASGVYDAINIKLMKCTGIREARDMIVTARALGLGVMLGCMTETSCAIAAAAQLGGLADWTDLDGAMLIANDPFEGTRIDAGRVLPSDEPGLGIRPRG